MRAFVRLLAVGLCTVASASAVQAQTRRGVAPAPNVQPSAAARTALSAPKPAGLRPIFPAGISSGSGARDSSSPIASNAAPVPASSVGAGGTTTVVGGGGLVIPSTGVGDTTAAAAATQVLGAGPTVPGPSQYITDSGAGGFNATDLARSYFFADANHDGDLTRAEAARLSIAPLSFEQMDRNFDGVISRFEYEDATH